MASRSYVARSSTMAATVVIVPATPTTVAACSTGTGWASRWASMSAVAASTSAAVGGSECRCRSCIRTEPMSMECSEVGAVSPRISSVEPPPTSMTSTGAGGVSRRLRTAPSKDSRASS